MASNTKLDTFQKSALIDLKQEATAHGVELFVAGRVTVAFRRLGNTVRFANSVASPCEMKIRRKVGQFIALNAYFNDQTTILPVDVFDDYLVTLENFADSNGEY